jgi:hypothetical protein
MTCRKRKLLCAERVAVGALVFVLAGTAAAWETYSVNRDLTNCRLCHGDFRAAPYTSRGDGESWPDGLHDTHQAMVENDCNVCHSAGPAFPVLLGTSLGGVGLDPIACAGCHGRAQDGTGVESEGYGAGLRQHHWVNGVTSCGNAGCHVDANPAAFTPVGEWAFPPYYATNDPNYESMPSDPCNRPSGFGEDYAATTLGLDNDGNNLYDAADLTACPEPKTSMLIGSGVGLLCALGRRGVGARIVERI